MVKAKKNGRIIQIMMAIIKQGKKMVLEFLNGMMAILMKECFRIIKLLAKENILGFFLF